MLNKYLLAERRPYHVVSCSSLNAGDSDALAPSAHGAYLPVPHVEDHVMLVAHGHDVLHIR